MEAHQAAVGDDELLICRMKRANWKCKSVIGDNELQYCEKHYNYVIAKKKKIDEKELPPDEQRCCQTSNKGTWRCRNFRMGLGTSAAAAVDDGDSSVPKTKFCEKHYYDYQRYYARHHERKQLLKMKTRGDGEDAVAETRDSKRRRKKVTEEDDWSVDETGGTQSNTADGIVEGGSANIGRKGKNVEREEGIGELESLTRIREVMKDDRFIDETRVQLNTNHTCDSDRIQEGGSATIGRNMTNVEITDWCRELESLTRIRESMVELETLEQYKSKCFQLSVELEKMRVELERKKVECTALQVKLTEVETRKTAATDETERETADGTECCRKMMSDFESRLLRMENQNSTMGCLESRISNLERLNLRRENENLTMGCVESGISNLESLVVRSRNGSSVLRCLELRDSEAIESEVRGLHNDVTRGGENQRDKHSRGTPNTEFSSGGRKDSHLYKVKTKEKVLNAYDIDVNKHHEPESGFSKYSTMNVFSGSLHLSSGGENIQEGNSWGFPEVRPSQHGSSSQHQLDLRSLF
ncbi:uncharacterized protein LOC113320018 isoform X2 [Papaver somniferum]|uniref:uncharacterized protein LOC113320018 isoform X2 n=1 Tax=Papaver somniferum TaxID=3469 RepID=UPI000E6FEA01|nr:uncharacterized protein LOC113320018 isoform X2 [Papaver somniferum]